MSWLTVVFSLVASLLGGGGMVAIINALAKRKVTKVEATERLTDSAAEWADKLQEHAERALKQAESAQRETEAVRQQMTVVRREAEVLAWELRSLRLAILDPAATLEALRQRVRENTGGSGSWPPI